MVWFRPLIPLKGQLDATAYSDISDNSGLPTLWQQLGESLFCFCLKQKYIFWYSFCYTDLFVCLSTVVRSSH